MHGTYQPIYIDLFELRHSRPRPQSLHHRRTLRSLGRDKTFFWIGSEGYIQTSPYTETFVVPTNAERSGDFSSDVNADGTLHTLYNPNDTYTDAAGGKASVRHHTPRSRGVCQ